MKLLWQKKNSGIQQMPKKKKGSAKRIVSRQTTRENVMLKLVGTAARELPRKVRMDLYDSTIVV
jgi:hypothetical protein